MTTSNTQIAALLEEFGGFGKFQLFIFLITAYFSALPGILIGTMYMVGYEPLYRCEVPTCENRTNTAYQESFLNFTTPIKDKKWSKCNTFKILNESSTDYYDSIISSGSTSHFLSDLNSSFSSELDDFNSCHAANFNRSILSNCSNFVYDSSIFTSTVVSQYELVCENSWLQPIKDSALMLGTLFGAIVLGDLGDRLGRKIGLFISLLLLTISGILNGLSINYYMFMATRFLQGFGSVALFQITFITSIEFVSEKWRTFFGIFIEVPFALGEASVAIFGYFIRDWRTLQLTLVVPFVLGFFLLWILPESVQWLISKGRLKEAKAIVERIEKMNKVKISSNAYKILESSSSSISLPAHDESSDIKAIPEKERKVVDILRYPNTRKRTLVLMFTWIAVTLAYYGLNANSGRLSGDFFINFIAIMLIEIPSAFYAYFIIDIIGRKGSLISLMLLAGISLISAGTLSEEYSSAITGLSIAGKFCVTAAFAIAYVYTSELYPTLYRSVGLGSCSMAARIGGILAPIIADMGKTKPSAPFFIFGTVSILAGVSQIVLPETKGVNLPQTLSESETFGTDQSMLQFTCCGGKKTYTTDGKIEDSENNAHKL